MLNATDLTEMTTHWLGCPVGGYLGSSYGSDIKDMLQRPMGSAFANKALAKLREDIPIIGALPASSLNIYAEQDGPERMNIAFDIAGSWVRLDSGVTMQGGKEISGGN